MHGEGNRTAGIQDKQVEASIRLSCKREASIAQHNPCVWSAVSKIGEVPLVSHQLDNAGLDLEERPILAGSPIASKSPGTETDDAYDLIIRARRKQLSDGAVAMKVGQGLTPA